MEMIKNIYLGDKLINLFKGNDQISTNIIYYDRDFKRLLYYVDNELKANKLDNKYIEDCSIWNKLNIYNNSIFVSL